MTYLNYLEQTKDTPVVHYHERLLETPHQRKHTAEFFFSSDIQQVWTEFIETEEEIYIRESVNKRNDLKSAFRTKTVRERNNITGHSLPALYSQIKTISQKYNGIRKGAFLGVEAYPDETTRVKTTRALKEDASDDQILPSELDSQDEASGVDCLLSMAGMFASEGSNVQASDISDRDDISTSIIRKHGFA